MADWKEILWPKKGREFLLGKDEQWKKQQVLNRGQRDYLKDLLSQLSGQSMDLNKSPLFQQGQSYLSNLMSGSPESTAAFEAPMMRQFNEEIMPGIAEQFAGVGGLSSSGFQQQAAQAGTGLAERLQALRSGMQFQGAQQGLGYAEAPGQQAYRFGALGLGTPAFGYRHQQARPGQLGGIAQMMAAFG